MNGPQAYAKISSLAQKFISEPTVIKTKVPEKYEYLGVGANLPQLSEKESEIHKFLSQTALSESVDKEFGKTIDILG